MNNHFDNLIHIIPNFKKNKILDLGSGKGEFLVDAGIHGAEIYGVEYNPEYIVETEKLAKEKKIHINIKQGVAEDIPYPDDFFDFVNIAEVIEHVENPEKMLKEVYRVLKPGGRVYLSAPNRFGFKDQHFKLYFVNWLPRSLADIFIGLFGKHKIYDGKSGRQRLRDMHYYTFPSIVKETGLVGFECVDIRKEKIINKKYFLNPLYLVLYKILKFFYFDSFHLILTKPGL